MRRILIASSKGGCGKTTLATNLAAHFAQSGKNTALVELDRQGSSFRWCELRPGNVPGVLAIDGGGRKGFSENVLHMPVMAVVQYWGRQLVSVASSARPPTVKASDDEVLLYVAKTSGAVGYVASGTALPPGVKAVTIVD